MPCPQESPVCFLPCGKEMSCRCLALRQPNSHLARGWHGVCADTHVRLRCPPHRPGVKKNTSFCAAQFRELTTSNQRRARNTKLFWSWKINNIKLWYSHSHCCLPTNTAGMFEQLICAIVQVDNEDGLIFCCANGPNLLFMLKP